MQTKRLAQSMLVALVLTGATGFVGGCDLVSGREFGGAYADDVAINTKVKANLVNQLGLKGIEVRTLENVVQLSGFVNSQQTKMQAGQIARNVEGVREVKNDLIVR